MTHKAQIAAFLKKPGARLTAMDALRMWGVFRLAARVAELRQSGMQIESRAVSVTGRNGKARVAEYYLARGR